MELEDLPQPERVDTVSPDSLEVDGDNPNEQNDEMFGLLCENMRSKGWLGNHIIADTNGLIADGEHRWRAAQEIGLEEVPVKFYEIDDSDRRLWRQELNKISGEHDKKRDALEYKELLDNGKSDEVNDLVDATGEDLDELLAEIKVDNSLPPAYEYDPEHNVYFEDCVEGMRNRLDDNSVDMVFTSPPYNFEKSQAGDRMSDTVDYEDNKSVGEFRDFLSKVFSELKRVVKPSGHIFINLDPKYNKNIERHDWVHDAVGLPHRSTVIWDKNKYNHGHLPKQGQFQRDYEPIYHYSEEPSPIKDTKAPSIWDVPTAEYDKHSGKHDYEHHPAPFSVALVERALGYTTDKGDTILDPFMGSGTTAVAAIQNDRDYIGFELDEEGAYKPIIERRIGEAKRQVQAVNGS